MINFIIVYDFNFWINYLEDRITKILFNVELNYKIYKFNDFDENFFKITNKNLENKLYILNINNNGLKIAEKIRKFDKKSEFIFFTSESKNCYLRDFSVNSIKTMGLFDKTEFNIFDKKIIEFINNYYSNKLLKLNTISNFNIVKLKDILYVETKNRKTIIHTQETIIKTSKNLHYIEDKLKKECDFFIRTHRACIVNIENVLSFDFKDKKITFFNNKKCHLLSKGYKNNIKNKISKY